MARQKVEMNEEQKKLFSILEKQVKTANSRIDRIEKSTGKKDSWSTRILYSKLDTDKIQAINKSRSH